MLRKSLLAGTGVFALTIMMGVALPAAAETGESRTAWTLEARCADQDEVLLTVKQGPPLDTELLLAPHGAKDDLIQVTPGASGQYHAWVPYTGATWDLRTRAEILDSVDTARLDCGPLPKLEHALQLQNLCHSEDGVARWQLTNPNQRSVEARVRFGDSEFASRLFDPGTTQLSANASSIEVRWETGGRDSQPQATGRELPSEPCDPSTAPPPEEPTDQSSGRPSDGGGLSEAPAPTPVVHNFSVTG